MSAVYEWYYVGQYGQLGPLSLEQMVELAEGRVITGSTYVWKPGFANWSTADTVPDLRKVLAPPDPPAPPPFQAGPSPSVGTDPVSKYAMQAFYSGRSTLYEGVRSPHSRVLAAVLQVIPGVGRMYLGYLAIGLLQMLLTLCTCGALILWSWIDGILILAGQVRYDGYGRLLAD